MLLYIYTLLLYLTLPFILLRLYWKGRFLPAYRSRIHERFALNSISSVDVWLHAVSLGEVVAATPLIDALLAKEYRVLVTTMTPTGSQQVISRFGEKVTHQYIPYDLPWVLRQFFKKLNARVGIIMETEIWPNLICQASIAKLSLVLVNARISDKAFRYYQRVGFFFKPILANFKAILTQSEQDTMRFRALGAPAERVHALGNIKFDLNITVPNEKQFQAFKNSWGQQRPVLIAASTHDDEENQLLNALSRLKDAIPDFILLIAPRHPERFKTVYDLCQHHGLKTGLRSQPSTINLETDVLVVDSLGELLGFYQVSDYAFVGGSLVPVGGHNVLEPIAMQVPVFCGPFMQNSKTICADLLSVGAIQLLNDVDELINAIIKMHHDALRRRHQVASATELLVAHRGVVGRYIDEVMRYSK